MQTLGKVDRKDTPVMFRPDPDKWLAFNCRYCKNIATCSLYRSLIDSQKNLGFESTSYVCPWLRYQ